MISAKNSKSESRNSKQYPNPKKKIWSKNPETLDFLLWILDLFRISRFVIRICLRWSVPFASFGEFLLGVDLVEQFLQHLRARHVGVAGGIERFAHGDGDGSR